MPHWIPTYKRRIAGNILSYAVHQNKSLLEAGGIPCYLLKRKRRATASSQLNSRKVDWIENAKNTYSLDPDTGMYRTLLWEGNVDTIDTYPDIGTLTCTVQASGGSDSVWEVAADKYSFIVNREEYAFDIYNNEIDDNGDDITDSVYVVFNTPPFVNGSVSNFIYGSINPKTRFEYMQPSVDNETGFYHSIFSFDQWINHDVYIRRRKHPHQFLVAFPGVLTDITMTDGGFLRQSQTDYWSLPPGKTENYGPEIVEHDVVVRADTGQRYQVTRYTPIYIESILVSQHFQLTELDPRSSYSNIPVVME